MYWRQFPHEKVIENWYEQLSRRFTFHFEDGRKFRFSIPDVWAAVLGMRKGDSCLLFPGGYWFSSSELRRQPEHFPELVSWIEIWQLDARKQYLQRLATEALQAPVTQSS
jgi:hypothetical protein